MRPRYPNLGIHPEDPDYDDSCGTIDEWYDNLAEEEEWKEEFRRENRWND